MIRLVASDIDGTLVPEGSTKIDPELFEEIRELRRRGILFAAASGRQYANMRRVFAPVADEMIFIAENGSNVMCRGKNMAVDYIAPALAEELVLCLRTVRGGELMLSTPECIFLETKNEEYAHLLQDTYRIELKRVDDLLPYCARTNKISIYLKEGVEAASDRLSERFGDRLNVAISGKEWVDFMSRTADKGNALAQIQRLMRISREETMAFGDNCNDVGMLGCAAESFAVENANPRLLAVASHVIPPFWEKGVIRTIREKLLDTEEAVC